MMLPTENAPELSVIILTHNRYDDTRRCLVSLQPLVSEMAVQVVVVDNGSTDGTPARLAADFPSVTLITNAENRGVAAGRNQGLAVATAQRILILDNDTVVNKTALLGMMRYLDTHPEVGLCGCCMTDAQGNVQRSFRPFPGLKGKLLSVVGLRMAREAFHFDAEGVIEPFYVIGACQMMRREAVRQVGPLDEAIFYGPEDADYCHRLRLAGWQVKYLPQFSIIHTYYRHTAHKPLSRLGVKHIKGLLHLYKKYHRIS
ncbi:MAG: glycosyltransferase family 2 protein [Muribaculaceae bacterium]|nr:glycosyltransferase family 2 protein [Muribaculaceae bacterium]